jgi:hypothetical protein
VSHGEGVQLAGFRNSFLGTRWCMLDRAVFAGVNPTGKRLYDGFMLSTCRRGVC